MDLKKYTKRLLLFMLVFNIFIFILLTISIAFNINNYNLTNIMLCVFTLCFCTVLDIFLLNYYGCKFVIKIDSDDNNVTISTYFKSFLIKKSDVKCVYDTIGKFKIFFEINKKRKSCVAFKFIGSNRNLFTRDDMIQICNKIL